MSRDIWIKTHKRAQDDYVTHDLDQIGFEAILAGLGICDDDISKEVIDLKEERNCNA